jgi:hypothetical protein
MKNTCEHLISILAQFRHETQNFKAELSTMSDIEILNLKPVTRQFLDVAPRLLAVVKPQHFVELRLAISYLADLYDRQAAAQEREYARFVQHSRMVKAVANAPITDAQKIEIVKDHYGWV